MNVVTTELSGLLIIEPKTFRDERGFFFESFQAQRYAEHGITLNFVQDNISRSNKHVLRGLHYQLTHPQGKLIGITHGRIFDVAVDIRHGSPTFGRHVSVLLDSEQPRQLYIPPGFAHGFCVLSDTADFYYKCTDYYCPTSEQGICWNDPGLNVPWPVHQPLLSPKDAKYPCLKDISPSQLPKFIAP